MTARPLWICCVAEVIGTFLLIFFGLGAVQTAVLHGDMSGLWQVGMVWGVSIMLAIYAVGAISGAHINPAITIGLASWGLFPLGRVAPYVTSQVVGAFLAAAVLFAINASYFGLVEAERGIVRGEPASIVTAMCFGEYYPNPGKLGTEAVTDDELAAWQASFNGPMAFVAEMLGTAILAIVVLATTEKEHLAGPKNLAPVFIGICVAALICVIAPLTQACFNPARDFGPRLFAYFAGWGSAAIPGPNGIGIVTVYIIAPIVGSIVGCGLFQKLLLPYVIEPTASPE
ncbi:MIP/aquaporin family protein [Blastopirellula retiformator]|uniref:Glycerol uptake facilitator protein n=1 Tax=Blastopirellula retiformator TaxID=2527970 RepID=A0A5C5V0A2_9BACT|nr:aquaporin [Blastopirellula retiformator]TWT31838.1 Glycerol uptake facilitator protein [Blastopirellula retiformator]